MKKRSTVLTALSIVLLFELFTSSFIFHQLRSKQIAIYVEKFHQQTHDFFCSASQRILRDKALLQSIKGFFNASEYVSKQEWEEYLKALELPIGYPAIRWVGVAEVLKGDEQINALVSLMKEKEDPKYKIWPSYDKNATPLIYVYPDLYKELSGYNLALSPQLSSQLADPKISPEGFTTPGLNFSPVGKSSSIVLFVMPMVDKKEKSTFKRWILASLDLLTFVNQIVEGVGLEEINIQIYKGEKPSTENLIFERSTVYDPKAIATETQVLEIGNEKWAITFSSTPHFREESQSGLPYIVFAVLIAISLGIILFLYKIFNSMSDSSSAPSDPKSPEMRIDKNGIILSLSPALEQMLKCKTADMGKEPIESLFEPAEIAQREKELSTSANKEIKGMVAILSLEAEKGEEHEWTLIQKDQGRLRIRIKASQVKNDKGEIEGLKAVFTDINKERPEEKK